MLDVLNAKSYKLDDVIFFITSSVDKPHLYVKCQGKILKKHHKRDNIIYEVQLKRVFMSVEVAKTHLHRRVFKTRKSDSSVAVMKKVYCSNFFDSPESFSDNVCTLLEHHSFIIPSVFVADSLDELTLLHQNATDVMLSKLRISILEIEQSK